MRVEVRLFATFSAYLPPGSTADAAMIEVPEGATVADVATGLGIPPTLSRVTLVNGEDTGPDRRLAADDVVALFPPLAGG